MNKFWQRRKSETGAVDQAVKMWREACPTESLSATTRSRIVRQALRPQEPSSRLAPLATLFMPTPRLAFGVAAPAILLTFGLGYWLVPEMARTAAPVPQAVRAVGMTVETVKTEGEVIFIIANGHRSHRVYRSVSADNLQGMEASATSEGKFRDGLEGPDLVFYRIE